MCRLRPFFEWAWGSISLYGDGASSLWEMNRKEKPPKSVPPSEVSRLLALGQPGCGVGVQPLTAAGATVGQEPEGRAGLRCCGQHKVFHFQPRGRANFTPGSQKVRAWWPGWMRHSLPEARGNLIPQTLGI